MGSTDPRGEGDCEPIIAAGGWSAPSSASLPWIGVSRGGVRWPMRGEATGVGFRVRRGWLGIGFRVVHLIEVDGLRHESTAMRCWRRENAQVHVDYLNRATKLFWRHALGVEK